MGGKATDLLLGLLGVLGAPGVSLFRELPVSNCSFLNLKEQIC